MRLDCRNLSFRYPETTTPVIDSLSFSMEGPGFNAVFGPSGSGKTSLAKLIATADTCIDGTILTQEIKTVLYSYNLERLPGWSSTGTHLHKVTPPEKQLLKTELCSIFKLNDVLGSRFSELSMGQQNRINLIRYLVQDFDLLIMDESLANVDEALRETILLSIKSLFPDRLFLYISHNLMEVAKFCKTVLVFSEPSTGKGYSLVQGLDCRKGDRLERKELDAAMLEIMNAF